MESPSFTAVQESVLTGIANRRVAVVRAGPGSGKTLVFAEAFQRAQRLWSHRIGGIAALSFTNVARDEIAGRLDSNPAARHFLGTLDSFFWRFVVVPFSHLEGVSTKGATLVPSPLDKTLDEPKVKHGPSDKDWECLFRMTVQGGDEGAPEITRRDLRLGGSVSLADPFRHEVFRQKQAEWARTGRLTHSDCHYITARILKGQHGVFVGGLLARRFPLLLVDEFQDTGWFLGRALLTLLSQGLVRAVLVGDPDQAIYQFGGAYRDLFNHADQIAQEPALPLHETHRCSSKISKVSSALSRSGKQVVASDSAPDGETILVVHKQGRKDISAEPILDVLRVALQRQNCSAIGVLARKGDTVLRLRRQSHVNECPWSGGVGHRLNVAAGRCLSGEVGVARSIVENELAQLVLAGARPTRSELHVKGVPLLKWRRYVGELILEALKTPTGETWNGWMDRMKASFRARAVGLGWQEDKKRLGARFKHNNDGGDRLRLEAVDTTSHPLQPGLEILTVHHAKGRTFEGIILYVPKLHGKNARCPSDEWWSPALDSEEMEVAFVALSRARRVLAIAVHETVYENLRQKRPDFVSQFSVMTLPATVSSARKGKKPDGPSATEPRLEVLPGEPSGLSGVEQS